MVVAMNRPTIGDVEMEQRLGELRASVRAAKHKLAEDMAAAAKAAAQASVGSSKVGAGASQSGGGSSQAGMTGGGEGSTDGPHDGPATSSQQKANYTLQPDAYRSSPSFPKASRDNNVSLSSFLGSPYHNPQSPPPGYYDVHRGRATVDVASVSRTRPSTFSRRMRDCRPMTGAQAMQSLCGMDKLFVQPGPEPGSYEFPAEAFYRALSHKGFGTPEVVSQVGRFPPTRKWSDTHLPEHGDHEELKYQRTLPRRLSFIPSKVPQVHKRYEDAMFRARKKDLRPATVRESRRDVMLFTKAKTPAHLYKPESRRPQTCEPAFQAQQKAVTLRLPLDESLGGTGSQQEGAGVGLPPSSLATATSWHRFKLRQKQKTKAAQSFWQRSKSQIEDEVASRRSSELAEIATVKDLDAFPLPKTGGTTTTTECF